MDEAYEAAIFNLSPDILSRDWLGKKLGQNVKYMRLQRASRVGCVRD